MPINILCIRQLHSLIIINIGGVTMKKHPYYFWHISYGNASMYLLGTIHMVPKSFFPLPRSVLTPFHNAKYLVCEVDISQHTSPPMAISDTLLEDATLTYPPGESLYHYFDRKKIHKLRNFLHKQGICTPQLYNHFYKLKPQVIYAMTTQAIYNRSGIDPTRIGIDHMLLNLATKLKKPILELESMAFQEQLLADCYDISSCSAIGDSSLFTIPLSTGRALKKIKDASHYLKTISKKGLWAYKYVDTVSQLVPPDHPLLGTRNKSMADKLGSYLQTDDSYFVAIGALHLHGKGNVLERLEAKGYTIRKIL